MSTGVSRCHGFRSHGVKICLLCDAQSIHFQRWATYLQMRGHTVKIFSQRYEPLQGIEVSPMGVPRAPIPMSQGIKKFFKALYRIKRGVDIRRQLKGFSPHLIHAHFLTDAGWIASWTGYHPFVLTAHGSDVLVHPNSSLIDKFTARYCLRKADVVTTVANHMKKPLLKLGCLPSKLVRLPNFVDIEVFNINRRKRRSYGTKLNQSSVLSVRDLKPIYHVDVLIKAIPAVVREIPDVKFYIIGEGSEKKALVELAKELQVLPSVQFIAHQPHRRLSEIFQQADIYVSTSWSDGLCVSLLEAMASGLYPIVTDIPGSREVIEDGTNGSLVPRGDEKALGAKIIEIIRNPQALPAIIRRNFELIQSQYEQDHVMSMVEDLYCKIVERSEGDEFPFGKGL